jgi:hypothetical protein
VSVVPWLIIAGSGLDDWIYWQLRLQSLLITINYSAIANLPTSQITKTRYPFYGNGFITELSLQITMKSSCHFLFNQLGLPTLQNSTQCSSANSPISSSRAERTRAERSSSLLPATSQHGHFWHRAPLGPMATYLFNVKTFVFSFFRCSSLIKREVLDFFYNWCSLTTPYSTRGHIKVGDIYILYIIHKTQTDTKFYYIQGHLSMQDSATAYASTYLNLRNGS